MIKIKNQEVAKKTPLKTTKTVKNPKLLSVLIKARKEKHKEAIKQKIILAAKKILEKEGLGEVTIRRISSEIKYALPMIYTHFKDKAEIMAIIIEDLKPKIRAKYNGSYEELLLAYMELAVSGKLMI